MKKLSPFEKATERYQNAQKMMFVKERLKKELPPRGSAAYRYFSDPDKNPPSYYSLVESIDNICKMNLPELGEFSYSIYKSDFSEEVVFDSLANIYKNEK